MTSCPSCGAERREQDRFCCLCVAMVMHSVGDLVDTQRFYTAAAYANVQTGSRELTTPFYAPPPAQSVGQTSGLPYQTASLRKKRFKRYFVWVMAFLIFSSITLAGIAIGARSLRSRRPYREPQTEQTRVNRRPVNEDIQNALGFKPGNINDAGYPGVKGIFVDSLMTDDGPAALANIQAGDVLTDLNGQPVRNPSEVSQLLDS